MWNLTSSDLQEFLSCGLVNLRGGAGRLDLAINSISERQHRVQWEPTSMYLLPMWCLWRSNAKSRCSELMKRTKASPFLLPWALRHSATPPLKAQVKTYELGVKLYIRTRRTVLFPSVHDGTDFSSLIKDDWKMLRNCNLNKTHIKINGFTLFFLKFFNRHQMQKPQ